MSTQPSSCWRIDGNSFDSAHNLIPFQRLLRVGCKLTALFDDRLVSLYLLFLVCFPILITHNKTWRAIFCDTKMSTKLNVVFVYDPRGSPRWAWRPHAIPLLAHWHMAVGRVKRLKDSPVKVFGNDCIPRRTSQLILAYQGWNLRSGLPPHYRLAH